MTKEEKLVATDHLMEEFLDILFDKSASSPQSEETLRSCDKD